MLFISQPAYIDPSVMTYAVQAIAGVVIAVGAVVVVFWRRAKKKVADKLGLEEKSKRKSKTTSKSLKKATIPQINKSHLFIPSNTLTADKSLRWGFPVLFEHHPFLTA